MLASLAEGSGAVCVIRPFLLSLRRFCLTQCTGGARRRPRKNATSWHDDPTYNMINTINTNCAQEGSTRVALQRATTPTYFQGTAAPGLSTGRPQRGAGALLSAD